MDHDARRRFFFFVLPALVALALLSLACGMGNRQVVEACRDAPDGDACGACCSEHGYHGNLFSSFDDPACECM